MQQKNQQFPLVQFQPHASRSDVYVLKMPAQVGAWVQGPAVIVPPGARVSILPSGYGAAGISTTVAMDDPTSSNQFYVAGSTLIPVGVTVDNLQRLWFNNGGNPGFVTIFLQDAAVG